MNQLILVLSFLSIQWSVAGTLRGINETNTFVRPVAQFRILLFATTMEENGVSSTFEKVSAVPIIGGKEVSDILYDIQLPQVFVRDHFDAIAKGTLFVAISESQVIEDEVYLAKNSDVKVILDPRLRARSSKPLTRGKQTITIVRVSTLDSTPSHNAASLIDGLFSKDKINLRTQYKACSFGQLEFELSKYGVIEIKVDQPVSDFSNGSSLVSAAQDVMREKLNIKDPSELSDKVMMCLPPGTGNWVASSGVGHWRSQYNDKWCRSLTATMHELAHGLGLLHAIEQGRPYGDATGYMSAGHPQYEWPMKCFNGQNNHQLGWYSKREKRLKTSELKAGRLINLATFVDFNRTNDAEPVLVNIAERIFLQYNVAKDFNKDTEEKRDEVTVTGTTEKGSDALAGLKAGQNVTIPKFQGSGRSLVIEACRTNVGSMGADVMLVSVSLDRSLCNQVYSDYFNDFLQSLDDQKPVKKVPKPPSPPPPTKAPSTAPTKGRVPSPTPAPVGFWDLLEALGFYAPSTKLRDEPQNLSTTEADDTSQGDSAESFASTTSPTLNYASGVKSVFDHDKTP